MYKVATLNKISHVGLNLFPNDYSFTENVSEAHGILVRSQDMLDMQFSDELLTIARAGAGVNNIPCDRCAEEGIVVFNTPGANSNAVKELVLAAMLADARNLYDAMHWTHKLYQKEEADIAKTVEKGKGQFAGHELKGKKICVIGLGAIGVLVANACEALGMNVVGYAPFMTTEAAHALSSTVRYSLNIKEAVSDCDYISIHVPASPATNGMINAELIKEMKEGACVLNFARDKLVDEVAMLEALENDKLRKYITDFPNDTIVGKKNVIYIPHLGASTEEAEDNCAVAAVNSLMAYIEHGSIEHSVNYPNCPICHFERNKGRSRICILNKNVPAMLGKITSVLAELNCNIDNMVNKSKGDFAYTAIDVDSVVDEAVLKEKLSFEGIIRVRVII